MNEEEQEALKVLKGLEFEEYDWYVRTDKIEGHANDVVEKVEKALQTILNLVEKQQKEIEKLKSRKYIFNTETNEIKEIPISENYISKDKIKEKIKLLKDIKKAYCYKQLTEDYLKGAIEQLEELLSDQEDECRENTEILSKKEIIERYKNNSLLEKLYEGE